MIFIRAVLLFGIFIKEVFLANLQIAQLVLWKPSRVQPALIKIPLDIKSDRGIFILSSMITLTPGTLSLEVSADHKFLYVHVTHTRNPSGVVASIKNTFEKKLMELGC